MVDGEWVGPSAVRVEVACAEKGAVTMRLTGDLDLSGEATVNQAIADLLATGVSGIVIDVAGVDFCDSSGIRILVKSCRDGRAVGVPVRVESVQPPVAEVLRLTGVWSLLTGEAPPDGSPGPLPDGSPGSLPDGSPGSLPDGSLDRHGDTDPTAGATP